MPNTYVNPISTRLSLGKSIPAIRAIRPPISSANFQKDVQKGQPARPQEKKNRRHTLSGTLRIFRLRERRWGPFSTSCYPWRCLCLGFSHSTRTTPRRRTTLHLEQIGLTDDLTFIILSSLFESVRNSAAREIVRRQFHGHFITRQNSNEMHPHFSRDMGQYLMTIIQLNSEHGVRQRLGHRPLYLDHILFRHCSRFYLSRRRLALALASRCVEGHSPESRSYVRSEPIDFHRSSQRSTDRRARARRSSPY